jgi:predicted nuclease of predicted toxin-antitoxin system
MKVLVDMNLSPRWVSFLSESGFEAVHWSDIGAGGAPDSELMLWATEHDHIVLTADLDFGAILAATQVKRPSVMQVRDEIPTPEVIGRAVTAALRQACQELTEGALVSVDAARARVRILPLRD